MYFTDFNFISGQPGPPPARTGMELSWSDAGRRRSLTGHQPQLARPLSAHCRDR